MKYTKRRLVGIVVAVALCSMLIRIPAIKNFAQKLFFHPPAPQAPAPVSGAGSVTVSSAAEWGFFLIPKIGNPLDGLRSVSWTRLTGVWWGRVQRADGTYDWSELDEQVQRAQLAGYGLILELKTGNNELISDPACLRALTSYGKSDERFAGEMRLHSCPLKPGYLSRWEDFVRTVIERYGGGRTAMPGLQTGFRLDIQIENEAANPYYWHWNESDGKKAAESFLEILKAAVRARDNANKDVQIILPGFIDPNFLGRCARNPADAYCTRPYYQRNRAFTEEVLRHPEYFDAVDVHFFNYFKFDPYYIRDGMEWLRAAMRANGYEKPVYSLEWTGAILMPVKTEGHAAAFAGYFPYTGDFKTEEAFGAMYKNLPAPENNKYREWFEAEQAREFPKLFTAMLAEGIRRTVYVRFSDFAGNSKGWDNIWWNWQGLVRFTGTEANPVLIRKPMFYAYQMLEEELYGYRDVTTLDAGPDVFAYRFSFADKPPVLVLWTEGPQRTMDLTRFLASGNVTVLPVVTMLDAGNNPVRNSVLLAPASAVPLTATPAFVKEAQ